MTRPPNRSRERGDRGGGDLLAAALRYTDRGFRVFPLHTTAGTPSGCSCWSSKRPECSRVAKHPRTANGFKNATTDEAKIRRWWKRWPEANVGIATGAVSNLVALDVDPDKGGEESLAALEGEHEPLPVTARQLTGGDGLHYLFAHPGVKVKNQVSGRELGDGLDVRGDGGYIVAAPSKHKSGGEYAWLALADELPTLPEWLLERVREQPRSQRPPAPRHAPRSAAESLYASGSSRYGLEALEREAREVQTAPEGTRNHALNRAAFNVGQLVAGGELDERTAVDTLTSAALSAGLIAGEIGDERGGTLGSGLSKGKSSPRTAPERPARTVTREVPNEAGAPPPEPPVDDGEPADRDPTGRFEDTDLGNAKRLVDACGEQLRWVPQLNLWLVWDGRRWAYDRTGRVDRMAKRVAESIMVEAVCEASDDKRKRRTKWAFESQKRSSIANMIHLARTEEIELGSDRLIPVEPHELDADDWQLNVLNGTIDLRTGELHPHDPAQLITKLAPVDYAPDAIDDVWDQFLATATDSNVDLIAFLQRAVGYSLAGSATEEVLFFVHGPGASGKSTLLDAIETTLGDYARRADFETFLSRNQVGGPRGDIARLAGARFVSSIEVDEGKKLAEGLVKTITGGDRITAAYKYQDEFEYRPQFTLWLAANHAPRVRHGDSAMWRRILRIPFEHVIPPADRDPEVKAYLRDPERGGPGVLAWAVHGCRIWLAAGLQIPDTVTRATDAYRADQDPIRDFLEDECVFDHPEFPGRPNFVTAKDLRAAYERWADENGQRVTLSPKAFRDALEEHGARPGHRRIAGRPQRLWDGLRLRGDSQFDDPLGDSPGISDVASDPTTSVTAAQPTLDHDQEPY